MVILSDGTVLRQGTVKFISKDGDPDQMFIFNEDGESRQDSSYVRDGRFLRLVKGTEPNHRYIQIGTGGKKITPPKIGDKILFSVQKGNGRVFWSHPVEQSNDDDEH